ncbi:hypothetical protein LTR96_007601 [Exophiala xenobiotica]|uniref:Fatty acid desaturase domain-containing protein n=1 Tax=Vermiconidia calcicola TaxID=1690605 RepID=A0AAV9QFQ8_9PEZI|nr:hypothetical protein LTR47_001919 [Exophiala xenobiotica]KAK5540821.1 hypothetical protein LTR25_002598 [Vermiconidia calcicola]KAK5251065.1 hypothetical protein LTS06_004215 [Exophiala xenobiotica]KAK5266934.1 hypothetical protein LTR96_007601 [Exophiala xenobiotica]KAK5283664.1 hypothetical protein LTR40_001448 [Exophiala xenobiotica]
MSTTALPSEAVLRRMATTESTPASSTNISPLDSPRSSPSSTSLSSLASEDAVQQKSVPEKTKLVDTYGNSFEIPDYTISDIHKAIPKHCFERSAVTGLYYVARDVASLATTFYLFNRFVTPEYIPSTPLRAGLWFLYTVVQGLFGTGLWVLAHECGHQSFSPSKVLNDTVGWFCHSALMVPYFSWKISHGKHHKATGHLERDMVFVPATRQEWATKKGYLLHQLNELTEETPITTAYNLIAQQIGGWPMYLMTNVTGHNKHQEQREGRGVGKQNGFGGGVNHFDPNSPLYEAKDAKLILLSDLGLLITGSILFWVGRTYGFANLFVWYLAPYLWVNHWLAATIDREFGFIGRQLLHGIVETHVLHHYVSTIPFYHADEASEAIKKVMGRHYRSDTTDGPIGFIKSMWKSMKWCQWVEPMEGATGEEAGVMFFRNRNGLGMPPAKMEKLAS